MLPIIEREIAKALLPITADVIGLQHRVTSIEAVLLKRTRKR